MKIYICSTRELADAASYDAASLRINPIRREKLDKIRHMADKKRSLCAGLLLNYAVYRFRQENGKESTEKDLAKGMAKIEELALSKLLTASMQEYDYRRTADGKPFLADIPGFYFNLSHSGDYVLCACGSREIGADLQKTERTVRDALAKRVLTRTEYADYHKLPEEERAKEFFRIWTIKESCCKLTGKGLAQNFQDMEVLDREQQISLRGETRKIYFHVIPWKEYYWLAISYHE